MLYAADPARVIYLRYDGRHKQIVFSFSVTAMTFSLENNIQMFYYSEGKRLYKINMANREKVFLRTLRHKALKIEAHDGAVYIGGPYTSYVQIWSNNISTQIPRHKDRKDGVWVFAVVP